MDRHGLRTAGIVCGTFGLYGWAVFFATFHHDGVIGPVNNAVGTDWMVYDTAIRAWLDGDPALIYDGAGLTDRVNQIFAGTLASPLPYHPFLYPPPFLLMLLPFALLSFGWACAVFLVGSYSAAVTALRGFAADRAQYWVLAGSLLLCPAASNNAVGGQNGFLTLALMVGGFALAPARPLLGGALLGMLAYKPQFWLLVPVALLAARQWRVLAVAIVTVLLLSALSVLIFGIDSWRDWIALAIAPPPGFADTWREWGRLWDVSVYTDVALLGAPGGIANGVQVAAIGVGALLVFRAFSRPAPLDLQVTILLGASVLAAPHVSTYDLVLLAAAATLLFLRGVTSEFAPGELIVLLAAWLTPLFNPPRISPAGFLTPLLILAVIYYSRRRMVAAPVVVAAGLSSENHGIG